MAETTVKSGAPKPAGGGSAKASRNKKILIAVGAVAALFVVYKLYESYKNSASTGATTTSASPTDTGTAGGGTAGDSGSGLDLSPIEDLATALNGYTSALGAYQTGPSGQAVATETAPVPIQVTFSAPVAAGVTTAPSPAAQSTGAVLTPTQQAAAASGAAGAGGVASDIFGDLGGFGAGLSQPAASASSSLTGNYHPSQTSSGPAPSVAKTVTSEASSTANKGAKSAGATATKAKGLFSF